MASFGEFEVGESWRVAHPGASVGVLALNGVANPPVCAALDERREALEAALRGRFAGASRADLLALPELQAYAAYYRRFKKTYHILLQLESVALKGKPLPRVAALVEAVFIAELQNLLLTASHDLATLTPPVRLEAGSGDEQYTGLSGGELTVKAGDMYMKDALGVICSVIGGQDQRTRITPATRAAFFAVYAPPGIAPAAVQTHLHAIEATVRLIAPAAETGLLAVHTAE